MWQLTGYELGKMFKKKIVYLSLGGMLFFNLMLYQGGGISSDRVVTTEGETVRGTEAAACMQELGRRYKGS